MSKTWTGLDCCKGTGVQGRPSLGRGQAQESEAGRPSLGRGRHGRARRPRLGRSWEEAGGVQVLDGAGTGEGVQNLDGLRSSEGAGTREQGRVSKFWTVLSQEQGDRPRLGRFCRGDREAKLSKFWTLLSWDPRTVQGLDAFVEGVKPSKAWTLLSREQGCQTVRGLDAFVREGRDRPKFGRYRRGGQEPNRPRLGRFC
jgi:hypothetical protein